MDITLSRAFHDPQFTNISVTFLFTSNAHFQDRHTRFHGIFAFSGRISDKPNAKAEIIPPIYSPSQKAFHNRKFSGTCYARCISKIAGLDVDAKDSLLFYENLHKHVSDTTNKTLVKLLTRCE